MELAGHNCELAALANFSPNPFSVLIRSCHPRVFPHPHKISTFIGGYPGSLPVIMVI